MCSRLHRFVKGTTFQVIMTLLTVYALVGDDLRLSSTDHPADPTFYVWSIIALLAFAFEFWAFSTVDPDYAWSFYFYLDFLATISLIPDIGWLWHPIMGMEDAGSGGDGGGGDALAAAKSSRAATKAGRIVRVVRLVRLVRLVKLLKMQQARKEKGMEELAPDDPSVVGKTLTELTTQRVIILILGMLIVMPLFSMGFDAEWSERTSGLDFIHRLYQDEDVSEGQFRFAVMEYARNAGHIMNLEVMKGGVEVVQPLDVDDSKFGAALDGCPTGHPICAKGKGRLWGSSQGTLATKHAKEYTWDESAKQSDVVGNLDTKVMTWVFDTKMYDVATNEWHVVDPKTNWAYHRSLRTIENIQKMYRLKENEVKVLFAQGCYAWGTDDHLHGDADAVAKGYAVNALPHTHDYKKGTAVGEWSSDCKSVAYFDNRHNTKVEAAMNILKTCFIMFVLTASSIVFASDAERVVIGPIERMTRTIRQLADNPLGAVKAKKTIFELEQEEAEGKSQDAAEAGMETELMVRTLEKIGKLLQVGFGEAGATIIGNNMASSSGLNIMVPGRKIQAIFGFALIRNFADATECFREDVMLWCNTIAKVVHDAVNCFSGAPNRNLGDVFVCVWRIPDAHPEMEGRQADNALASFLKSMVDVYNENQPGGKLAPLNKDERLVKRFGEKFMVRLGYGLHIGWAIEGAIGSTFKIDASYLSPNVNMAARLMAATGQFGTPLLISHWLHEKFSGEARKKCRMLDRVTVKGSVEPMGLYTFDIKNVPKEFGTPKPVKISRRALSHI